MTLDEIVVTVTRVPTAMWRAPFSVHVVQRQDPRWRLARTTTDLLAGIPGVMTQKTSTGQGSPFLRGFTGFRNVYLVDGIRLNSSIFREGPNQYWNTIDPASLERVEVVMGPGAVAYGSDAVGGCLNAITRDPPLGDGQLYRELTWRAATAERAIGGRGALAFRRGPTRVLAGVSGRRFGELEGGRNVGRQTYTDYGEYGADLKLAHSVDRRVALTAAFQYLRQPQVPRTHVTVAARSFAGTTVGTDLKRELEQERLLTYVQLRGREFGGMLKSFQASASWQAQSEREYRVRGDGSARSQAFDVGTLGLWLQTELRGPLGRWLLGADHYRDRVNSSSSTSPIQGPVADDAAYDLTGAFVQVIVPFGQAAELHLGERFTSANASADHARDPVSGSAVALRDGWHSAVGSLRLSLRPFRYAIVYGGCSQGFRTPNLSDLTRFDNARTSEFEVAALDLEPERTVTFEVGAKLNRDGVSGQVAWFWTRIRDQIVRRPTGRLIGTAYEVTRANAGNGHVTGVELGAVARRGRWSLAPAFAWQEGKVEQFPTSLPDEALEPVSRLLPTTSSLAARWTDRGERIRAEAAVVLVARQDRLSTADRLDTSRIPPGGTPGYALVSTSCQWRPFDWLSVTTAIENVTDQDYRIHGSGSNEAGRNAIVFTSIEW